MKLLSFLGSPKDDGNSAKLVKIISDEAAKQGHSVEIVHLHTTKINGCTGCGSCKTGKVEFCIQDDEMQPIYRKIVKADCILLSSPIYFGYLTGPVKTFLDRWCTFFDYKFQPRHVDGKKFIGIFTCGAPSESYNSFVKEMKELFGEFFRMEVIDAFIAGDLMRSDDIETKKEFLDRASKIGQTL
jgi:multimeric flavodoxin WrbA